MRSGCVRLAPMTETAALARLAALEIETPSWGYGNSGTRFHVYPVARRRPHRLGADRRRRARPPADRLLPERRAAHPVGPRRRLAARSATTPPSRGIRIGAINPNLFGDDAYRLGSLCHPDARRARAGARALPRVRRDRAAGRLDDHQPLAGRRDELPGPGRPARTARAARRRARGALRACSRPACGLLVEYKFFEPGFYSTDLPDWGTAALLCRRLGPQAQVLVDTGHHPQGTNVEQIVACCSPRGCSAASTSTTASTPTTT